MGAFRGKAPADTPALKPYWGKPAVRNFRGDDGNVGIIRSPVRAIVLPDRAAKIGASPGLQSGERVFKPAETLYLAITGL